MDHLDEVSVEEFDTTATGSGGISRHNVVGNEDHGVTTKEVRTVIH